MSVHFDKQVSSFHSQQELDDNDLSEVSGGFSPFDGIIAGVLNYIAFQTEVKAVSTSGALGHGNPYHGPLPYLVK